MCQFKTLRYETKHTHTHTHTHTKQSYYITEINHMIWRVQTVVVMAFSSHVRIMQKGSVNDSLHFFLLFKYKRRDQLAHTNSIFFFKVNYHSMVAQGAEGVNKEVTSNEANTVTKKRLLS